MYTNIVLTRTLRRDQERVLWSRENLMAIYIIYIYIYTYIYNLMWLNTYIYIHVCIYLALTRICMWTHISRRQGHGGGSKSEFYVVAKI